METLDKQERNIVLTGDPFVEFDPFTYVLLYSFPQQAQNYPAIVQALPHLIIPQQQNQTPHQSPLHSPNSSGSEEFFTPPHTPKTPNQPKQGTSTGSAPKLLKKILRGGKEIKFKDPLEDRPSWIQKNLQKMQLKTQEKAEAKRIKAAASKARPSGGTSNN